MDVVLLGGVVLMMTGVIIRFLTKETLRPERVVVEYGAFRMRQARRK